MENREGNVSNRKRNGCRILKEKLLAFIKWVLGFCCGVWFLGMFLASGVAAGAGAAHRPESVCLGKGEPRGMISVLPCCCHSQQEFFSKVFQVGMESKSSSAVPPLNSGWFIWRFHGGRRTNHRSETSVNPKMS